MNKRIIYPVLVIFLISDGVVCRSDKALNMRFPRLQVSLFKTYDIKDCCTFNFRFKRIIQISGRESVAALRGQKYSSPI